MKFKTIAEAFNFYRTKTVEEMRTRAAQIGAEIDSDADADVEALNIELRGIKEALENAETRSDAKRTLSFFEGMKKTETRSFDAATVVDTPEYRSAFFKTLLGAELNETEKRAFAVAQSVAEKRADAYNTSSNSAAILPTTTLNEIVKKARTIGGLLAECRAFNVPTKVAIPVGTPSTRAAWHEEAAAVESENVAISAVTFDGYEIMKVFSISAKVRRMSIDAFEAYLVDELTACVMETLDYTVVNGTGEAQGTGLETGITWSTTGAAKNHIEIGASADFEYADIVSFVALLKRGYAAGAKMAMNNATLYNVFYGMTDENKRPVFIADPKDESVGKVLGFPVVIDDNIDDETVYLGNFAKYYGYNIPEGILVEASRDSGFKKGVIDYRALAVADCKPIVGEAFVKLSKASA